jgi:hypothetical protein
MIYCPFAMQVWNRICQWLNLNFCLPHSRVSLLNYFAEQGMVLIWVSTIWALWRQRNRIIFDNGTAELMAVVDEIKLMAWKWWIGKSNKPPCLLYEWMQEPKICIMRSHSPVVLVCSSFFLSFFIGFCFLPELFPSSVW